MREKISLSMLRDSGIEVGVVVPMTRMPFTDVTRVTCLLGLASTAVPSGANIV
jgi:hypothetical protein